MYYNFEDWVDVFEITKRNSIIGNPGYGKSTFGIKKFELYCDKGWPVTYVDPAGISVGIRNVRDDVVIIGGEYGDYTAREFHKVIENIMKYNVNLIIDLSDELKENMREMIGVFFESMFVWHKMTRLPRKYILDEADYFVPQYHFNRYTKEHIIRCISKGRAFGMGFDFITQNFTMIEKTVLKMCDNTVLFNLSDPIDLRRVKSLVGEVVDARLKALDPGMFLLYDKKNYKTFVVDMPDAPPMGQTPVFGEDPVDIEIKPLNETLREVIEK